MANRTSRHLDIFSWSSAHSSCFMFFFRILQFTSRKSVTSLFSLATTDIDLARLRHSTYPSALVSACQILNWPNKFMIWSSTSTLALSIGTLQLNAAQITDNNVLIISIQFKDSFIILILLQEDYLYFFSRNKRRID